MTQFFKATALLLLLCSTSIHLTAQDLVDWGTREAQTEDTNKNGVINNIQFKAKQPAIQEAQNILRSQLHMNDADKLVLAKKIKDHLGFTHDKYQQYHNGIKVEFGTYTVHSKNGKIQTMNGDYFPTEGINIAPTLSEDQALAAALSHINADSYMWESAFNEQFAIDNEEKGTYLPEGELVIVKQFLVKGQRPDLAYKFNIYAESPLSRDDIYVNAHTGAIVFKNAIIKHCFHDDAEHNHNHTSLVAEFGTTLPILVSGTAATRYSGSKSIETSTTTGGYRLRDNTRGGGINTYDMNTGTNYGSAQDFVDNDNNWTAGEWNNSAKDNAALDAHWGSEMTYDYFIQQHNRNSYNGNGAAINSYVHYSSNYDNAFWDGSRMTYGDGNTFDALTSLDVAAHEIGHGVCSSTANLVYSYESGALNEAFSDIWAACVEDVMAPGEKQPYLIGEDIGPGGSPLRNMINPNAEGQPDTYLGDQWYTGSGDNGGVHYNSGVLNHCFYILAVGESGTNDNGDSYAVPGIGIIKAGKIFYRAEAVYLSANSQYADARTACIQSAADLYGASSDEVCSTTNAFHATGVGAASSCAPPACDDGIQNGDETGVDCGGANCADCPPCTNVNVSITLDNYPEETSWTISSGGTTYASGGTYGSQPDGSTVSIDACLVDGCYDFTINDAYGDGICCSYGNGSYTVTDANGNVLASGGSFASSETTNFCLDSGGPDPVLGCTDASAHNYDPAATQDDGSCETCSDNVQNGDETGVDCGGALCAACPPDPVPGCTDASAHNYDPNATQDDGSCETCSDNVQNGDETGVDCGGALCAACPPDPIPGCTDASAHNYDPNATEDDGSCETCSDGVQNGDESGVDCGGALCSACNTGGCTDVTINSNDFEAGWGIWNDGGSDCARVSSTTYANSGSVSVRLRDNSGNASSMTTDALNLSNFEDITIDYSMYARSMENNEDYFIEINTGGGWVTVANYARGVHFNNNTRYNDAVTVTGPFSTSTTIRFRCDASGNNDQVYIDDVVLTGCQNQSIAGFGAGSDKDADIKDAAAATEFNIFPNPTRDILNVAYTATEENVTINVYNTLGQVVLTQQAIGGTNTAQLELANLRAGNYFIAIQNGEEQLVQKFVKY